MNTNNQVVEIEDGAEDVQVVAVTDDSGKKITKRVSVPRKFIPSTVVSGRDGRVPCAGGCNTMVLKSIGECRKCRRLRLKTGKRIIAKITKQQKSIIDVG